MPYFPSCEGLTLGVDAATVCGGYSDSSIKVWTLDGKSKGSSLPASKPYRSLIGHAGPVFSIDMSRDMRFVLSSSEDGTVRYAELYSCLIVTADF